MYLEIGMQNKTHLQNRKYAVAWELILYPGTHSFLSNSHIGSYRGKMSSPGSYEKINIDWSYIPSNWTVVLEIP